MTHAVASRVYDFYGRFYDRFELLFKRRLARVIGTLPFRPGDRVLDIGVGTGFSLEFYPADVQVTGIDISNGMLEQARRKVEHGEVRIGAARTATTLMQADALALPFSDGAFDLVFLSHVISTVGDPAKCLREAIRTCRDGGLIVLVNHFQSRWPVVSWVEIAIDPICRRLGWRSDLSLPRLLKDAQVSGDPYRASKGAMFRAVYLRKHGGMVSVTKLSPVPAPAVPSEAPA